MADRSGDMIASKYRLEGLLGSGGMGHVYRATNVRAGRAVAIKLLRSEHAMNAPVVERFLREAMAANLVRHPNVVDVLDVDKDDDGSPFIVQELLTGEDLSQFVARRGGPLTVREVEQLVLPVIDALAEAHARGVVHRDIKPENVFLALPNDGSDRRIPKLLDFGISKIRSAVGVKETEVGMMMGTPAYMSPEQVQGGREADPRTDVWAIGMMLFELLAGRLPYDEQDAPALFVAIATRDVPLLTALNPNIDEGVARVVGRCLRRTVAERYPSARELARDFRHVIGGEQPEPTQRAIPVVRLPPAPSLDIPDLALPAPSQRRSPEPAQPTQPVGNFALPDFGEAELPQGSSGRPTAPLQRYDPPELELGSSSYTSPVPHPPSSRRSPVAEPLPGMMMSGAPISSRRPKQMAPFVGGNMAPFASAPAPLQRSGQDMSFLIALGVVVLVAIFVTAALMTFLYDPDGWPVLGYVTRPTPETSLIAQSILALAALGGCVKLGINAVRRWDAHREGARGAAVFMAILAGGLLFAALQLGRAAF